MDDINTGQKTAREWFQRFPEPYRTKAINASIRSFYGNVGLNNMTSLKSCVSDGICWSETAEGHAYWQHTSNEIAIYGLNCFNKIGLLKELQALDKSLGIPPVTSENGLHPAVQGLPDALTAKELQNLYPESSDIEYVVKTDRGHLYYHTAFPLRGKPPVGVKLEALKPSWRWSEDTIEPGCIFPSHLMRWLPDVKQTDTEFVTRHEKPLNGYKENTIAWWFDRMLEPYRSEAFADHVYSKSSSKLDTVVANAGDAITKGIRFTDAKRKDWGLICEGLRRDPEFLRRCRLTDYEKQINPPTIKLVDPTEPIPVKPQTVTTEKEDTHMLNATYSIQKLLAKAEKELKANEAAKVKFTKAGEANKTYLRAIEFMLEPDEKGNDKPELAILREIQIPKGLTALLPPGAKVPTTRRLEIKVAYSWPKFTDNTVRLKRIITDLGLQSGDEITANDDITWVMQDFTECNANSELSDVRTFQIPEPRNPQF